MSIILSDCPPEQLQIINAGFCGARTRNVLAKGPFCKQPAGCRTEHSGEGRCWLHGGRNLTLTGKYSRILKTDLSQAVAEQEEDEAIYDTTGEIAALRAIIVDYINRYDENYQQQLDWHKSFTPAMPSPLLIEQLQQLLAWVVADYPPDQLKFFKPYQVVSAWVDVNLKVLPKPTKLLDISEVYKMLGEVTKMVERVGKMNSANAISRKDFVRIMTETGNIIDQCVPDEKVKAKIKSRLGALRLA